jgi:hypothetical protein
MDAGMMIAGQKLVFREGQLSKSVVTRMMKHILWTLDRNKLLIKVGVNCYWMWNV